LSSKKDATPRNTVALSRIDPYSLSMPAKGLQKAKEMAFVVLVAPRTQLHHIRRMQLANLRRVRSSEIQRDLPRSSPELATANVQIGQEIGDLALTAR